MTHDEKNKSDYYDWEPEERMEQETPEWKVYYSCNFNGYHGRERAGKEISVVKQFCWGDEVWHIPAVYSCTAGLVVDFCIEINPERIKSFFDKYYLSHEDDYFFTDKEREQINAENPLNFDFRSQIVLNGKTLHQRHSCSTTWIPEFCLPQSIESDLTSKWIIGHYGLDPSKGWIFHRAAFPWATKKRPTMRLLRLNLEQEPVDISRIYFDNLDISKSIAFSHPITDTEHTLTVMAYEKQEIDRQHFCGENLEFPTHYTKMTYVLSPEIPNQSFLISDCEKGDRPRQKVNNTMMSQASKAAAIGIIGGADGPTAIFLSNSIKAKQHVVCSALRYEPVNKVKWRMVFREKMRDDIDVYINIVHYEKELKNGY